MRWPRSITYEFRRLEKCHEMECSEGHARGRDQVRGESMFPGTVYVNDNEWNDEAEFDPPIDICAQPKSSLAECPQVPAEVDGGVGIKSETSRVNQEVEQQMRQSCDPDWKHYLPASLPEDGCEQRGPYEDHQSGVRPVIEEGLWRGGGFDAGKCEGDPEEIRE